MFSVSFCNFVISPVSVISEALEISAVFVIFVNSVYSENSVDFVIL